MGERFADVNVVDQVAHGGGGVVLWAGVCYAPAIHITLQPKTGCPLKLSRVEPGQYLDGRPPGKTRLLLEEVLVRPAGGAHPVVCVGPNAPV